MIGQAEAYAGRVRAAAGTDPSAQVARAWRLAYGCEPTKRDVFGAVAFLSEATATFRQMPPEPPTGPKGGSASKAGTAKPSAANPAVPPPPEARALAAFCQALLSSNRFLYVG